MCGKEFDLFQFNSHECSVIETDMPEITYNNEKQNTEPVEKENCTETVCLNENELDHIIAPDNTDGTNISKQILPNKVDHKDKQIQTVPTPMLNVTTALNTSTGPQSDNSNSNESVQYAHSTSLTKLQQKYHSNQTPTSIQSIDLTPKEDEEKEKKSKTSTGPQLDNSKSNESVPYAQSTSLTKLPQKYISNQTSISIQSIDLKTEMDKEKEKKFVNQKTNDNLSVQYAQSNQTHISIQSIDLTIEEDEEKEKKSGNQKTNDNLSATQANPILNTNSLRLDRFQDMQSTKAVFCEFCGLQYSNPKDIESHQLDSHANKHFMCYICGELFLNTSELMFHNAKKHCDSNAKTNELNSLNKTKDDLSSSKFRYYCKQCGQGFDLIYLLFIHKKNLIKLNQHYVEDGLKHVLTNFDLEKKKKVKPSLKKATDKNNEDKNTGYEINTNIDKSTRDDKEIKQKTIKDANFLKPDENEAQTGNIVKIKETCVKKLDKEQVKCKNSSDFLTQNNTDIPTKKILDNNKSSKIKKVKVNVTGLVNKKVNKFSKENFILRKNPRPVNSVKDKAKKLNTQNVGQKELGIDLFDDEQQEKSIDIAKSGKETNKNSSINAIDSVTVQNSETKKPSVSLKSYSKSKCKENIYKEKQQTSVPKLTKAICQREINGLNDSVYKLKKETLKKKKIETPKQSCRKATEVTQNTCINGIKMMIKDGIKNKEKQPTQKTLSKNILSNCNSFSIDDILNETNKDLNQIIHRHQGNVIPIKIKETVQKGKSIHFTEADLINVCNRVKQISKENDDQDAFLMINPQLLDKQIPKETAPNLQSNLNPIAHETIGHTSSLQSTNNTSVAISTEAMQIINEVSQKIDIYNTVKKVLDAAEFSDDAESDSDSHLDTISTMFCEACGYDCKDSNSLFEHMTSRHPGFDFVCFVCDQHFKTLDNVINHQKKHSKDNIAIAEKQFLRLRKSNSYPYYCNKCGKGFTLIALVANHKKNSHNATDNNKTFYDTSNEPKENRISQKRKSIESESGVKDNKPEAVKQDKTEQNKSNNRQADDYLVLNQNNSTEHTQDQCLQNPVETNNSKTNGCNEGRSDPNFPRFCEFCGQKYNSRADQIKDIHLEKYKCVICHKPHDLLDLLVAHYDTCHAKHEVANFEKVQISLEKKYHYFCKFCGDGFNFISNLLDHTECNHFVQIITENKNILDKNNSGNQSEIDMELTDQPGKKIEDEKNEQYKTLTKPANAVTDVTDEPNKCNQNQNKQNLYGLSTKKELSEKDYLKQSCESQNLPINTDTTALKEQSRKYSENETKLSDIAAVSDKPKSNGGPSLQEKKDIFGDLTDENNLLDASDTKRLSLDSLAIDNCNSKSRGPSNLIDVEDFFKERQKRNTEKTDTSNAVDHIGSQEWDELDKELDNVISLMTDDNSSEDGKIRDTVSTPDIPERDDVQSTYCEVCGLLFENIRDLYVHFTDSHRETPFKCSVCARVFADVKNLIRHQGITHERAILDYAEKYSLGMSAEGKDQNFRCYCSRCGKGFYLISSIEIHYKMRCTSSTSNKKIPCGLTETSKSLKRKPPSTSVTSPTINSIYLDTIKSHSTTTDRIANSPTKDTSKVDTNLDRYFKNPNVETNASNSSSFSKTYNKKKSSGMGKHICDNCNKSFSLSESLTFHKRTQTCQPTLILNDLSNPPANANSTGIPKLAVTNNKPVRCPVCPNRTFNCESNLLQHSKDSVIHKGLLAKKQKPWSCRRNKVLDAKRSIKKDVDRKLREDRHIDQQQQTKRVRQGSASQERVAKKFKTDHRDTKMENSNSYRKKKSEQTDREKSGSKWNAARPAVEVHLVKKINKDDCLEGIYTLQEARNLCHDRSHY